MKLIDTHCHIHAASLEARGDHSVYNKWLEGGRPDPDLMLKEAAVDGVIAVICVGTTSQDSRLAIDFASPRNSCHASIGIHPHEAADHVDDQDKLQSFRDLVKEHKVVAVGECGLDYYYEHSPRPAQRAVLEIQMQLAQDHNLPMIFHVREAFDDFWPIFDNYPGLKGVVHSFTATTAELDRILKRGLLVGLNGIMTFTQRAEQLSAARALPLSSLVIETDAPFLTPVPNRGKINQPKQVRVVAEFLADLRGETAEELATATTRNAQKLFGI